MEINGSEFKEPAEAVSEGVSKSSKLYIAFAVIALIASYFFVCLVPVADNPLGFLLLTVLFYAATVVFALLTGGRLTLYSAAALAVGLIASLYRVIHGDSFVFPIFTLSALSYIYLLLSMYGNNSRSIGGRFLLDIVKGIAYMFISFGSFFMDLFKPKGSKKNAVAIFTVLGGIIAACILLIIVGSLLSYDERFAAMMPKLDFYSISEFVIKLLFTVPIAAVAYSVYASSREGKLSKVSSEESLEKASSSIKIIPTIVIALPIAALLVMYVLYFVSQWGYYMSAFTHRLPEGYSAAGYAREGFFQLCAVACINAVLIILLGCFAKKGSNTMSMLSRILKLLLSLSTLVLIATAISKMLLYIDMYDMTRIRLYVTVFLVFLAIAFIFVILSLLFKKMKALPFIIGAALVFIIAFSLINTDGFIAKYNVDAYLNGKHSEIDIKYLEEQLDYNALPELVRLKENAQDEKVSNAARWAASRVGNRVLNEKRAWYKKDLPYLKAEKLLNTYDINS